MTADVGDCTPCDTSHPVLAQRLEKALTGNADEDSSDTVTLGDTLTYTVTVTNTSTDDNLTDVVVSDPMLDPTTTTCDSVAPTATCVLTGTYVVTAADVEAGQISNTAVVQSPLCAPDSADPACTTTVVTPVGPLDQTLEKALTNNADEDGSSTVTLGDTLTYTVTVTNTSASGNLTEVVISDPMLTPTGGTTPCASVAPNETCTLVGTYVVTADDVAAGQISNTAVVQSPVCPPDSTNPACTTTEVTPVGAWIDAIDDSFGPIDSGTGGTTPSVLDNDTLNGAPVVPAEVTLTPGTSPDPGLVMNPDGTITVAPGTAAGTYDYPYTICDVRNPDNCDTAIATVVVEAPARTTIVKTAEPATGMEVSPNQLITYTLDVTVEDSALGEDLTLIDTLSAGQTFGAVTSAGVFACSGELACVLPAGTAPGVYALSYTATVNADAVGTVGNNVVATNPDGGDPDPECITCTTTHPVTDPVVTVTKSSDPPSGSLVVPGQSIAYTVTVTVAESATTAPVTLADTLSTGQALSGALPEDCTASDAGLICTLPAGSLPGTYTYAYTAIVDADVDSDTVGNTVIATGEDDPECESCDTSHEVARPSIEVLKTAVLTVDGGTPGVGNVGDEITYSVTVTNTGNITVEGLVVEDRLNDGEPVVLACAPTTLEPGQSATCDSYSHTITAAEAAIEDGLLRNEATATAEVTGPDGTSIQVVDESEAVVEVEPDPATVRIVKTATPRDVRVGALVRYTLVMENTGIIDVVDATLVDTPPAGFNYVDGSLTVADRDGAGRLAGTHPILVDQIDIAASERVTITYLLRVGVGVRAGIHTNSAYLQDDGTTISNVATVDVQLVSDPMLDESLILGTVFDDRDGDGWQDGAGMDGVRVQGGFAPGAYVANSTVIDLGRGPQPVADASAPLLHGIAIGTIGGRQSDADPAAARQVVISQRLSALDFTDDFVLTADQGVSLRMGIAGNTRVDRDQGEAVRGLTAAEPTVERRVSQVEGGYRVDYVIGNAGVEERGIPGVRIASVEGLLVETDQFGRYHLVGVEGGEWERGRNFILKVDPVTVPRGSEFTTDNPRLRRVTPGLPARFDFGVKLPPGLVAGGIEEVEIELGEIVFRPDSAELRAEYLPVIDEMAARVIANGAGEVVIAANGASQALAYDRAKAVRDALLPRLPEALRQSTVVSLRADPGDPGSTLLSLGESPVLGTVLFDTGQSAIRPEFEALIAGIAADIERLGGGVVGVVGHADRRGSHDYNDALGLRRAKAVFEAIATRLGPEARARLRVDISDDPTAPVGIRGR